MIHKYSLTKYGKYSYFISIPRKIQKNYLNKRLYLNLNRNLDLDIFFNKPSGMNYKETKLIYNCKQPGFILQKPILSQIQFLDPTFIVEIKDEIFLSDDIENESITIHFGWNIARIRSILQINNRISIERICEQFSNTIHYDKIVEQFVVEKVNSLILLGEVEKQTGLIQKI